VNVYEPADRPEIVPVVPVLVNVPDGLPLTVHVPEEGKPLKATDPVGVEQVGCVTVPRIGVDGVPGAALMVTEAVAVDVQPLAFVTVNVYEPGFNPETVPVVPVPVAVPDGFPFTVQVPEAGNPLRSTDPVGVAQVG